MAIPRSDKIYITPSGVHKERILPEDLFVMTPDAVELDGPNPAKGYKQSQCTPLFFNAYSLRSAGAVIHTHSIHAVLVRCSLITHSVNGSVLYLRASRFNCAHPRTCFSLLPTLRRSRCCSALPRSGALRTKR
jgi:ribulose-5-phosphate 4-epimerase/fuculose-1-phosphate aldolase